MGFLSDLGWISLGIGTYAEIKKLEKKTREKEELEGEKLLEKINQEIEEQNREEEKRKSIPCIFDDVLTEEIFNDIIKKEVKKIKRVKIIEIRNGSVSLEVRSQSGISNWDFELDFNDYGKVTGGYWINTDNYDSKIPDNLGDRIQESIKQIIKEHI